MEPKCILVQFDDIWLGWNGCTHTTAITYLATRDPSYILNAPYAVIGCMDSERNIDICSPTVAGSIQSNEVLIERTGRSLITDGIGLSRLITTGDLFFGFDEIWLCDRKPDDGLPEGLAVPAIQSLLLSNRSEDQLGVDLEVLYRWMQRSGAYTGIADGLGLSFITRRREDVDRLMFFE